jgi:hypothetical protein
MMQLKVKAEKKIPAAQKTSIASALPPHKRPYPAAGFLHMKSWKI